MPRAYVDMNASTLFVQEPLHSFLHEMEMAQTTCFPLLFDALITRMWIYFSKTWWRMLLLCDERIFRRISFQSRGPATARAVAWMFLLGVFVRRSPFAPVCWLFPSNNSLKYGAEDFENWGDRMEPPSINLSMRELWDNELLLRSQCNILFINGKHP